MFKDVLQSSVMKTEGVEQIIIKGKVSKALDLCILSPHISNMTSSKHIVLSKFFSFPSSNKVQIHIRILALKEISNNC
jgi:hypothetical protein